jgi:PAS domain S-box-containing protein
MSSPCHVLLIAEQRVKSLEKSLRDVPFVFASVHWLADIGRALENTAWDAIVLELPHSEFDPFQFLAMLRDLRLQVPVVIISSTPHVDEAVHLLKSGAYDYLPIHAIARLPAAIQHAVDTARIHLDVQRLTESTLRESEERYRTVAYQTGQVIYDYDLPTGRIAWAGAVEAVTGYSEEAFAKIGIKEWAENLHPEDRDHALDQLQRCQEALDPYHVEYRFRRKDGSFVIVEDNGVFLANSYGIPYRMVGAMKDITDRRNLEEQFLRAQRLENIGALASGIAHDLNNVLAPILMASETLRRSVPDPTLQRTLQVIELSARRGADMVRQILSFARGVDSDDDRVRLGELLGDILVITRETFPRSIHIESQVPADLWIVPGDSTQLQQVLLNLCVNARDAMPDGGHLAIRAMNLPTPPDCPRRPASFEPTPCVLVEVADTGTGMIPEVLSRIFEPFFTTKAQGLGTGLGLPTAHNIIRSHGGFLDVSSQPGIGSTFRIVLPAQPDFTSETAPDPPRPRPVPRHGDGELILVVDDEAAVRNICQHTLEAFGYRVHTAADGAEALAYYRLRRDQIDAIVTDMMMPGVDGAEAAAAVLAINPSARIIVATGLADSPLVTRAKASGVKHFLAKPYSAEDLLAQLSAVLKKDAQTH